MTLRLLALLAALVPFADHAGLAATARHLDDRMVIDGFTGDFTPDESVFGFNDAAGAPEEGSADSKWGPDNDVQQIRITWDARYLYLAVEGVIFGNNTVLLLDVLPDRGIATMNNLNSWSRNVVFENGFFPDLFAATWDGNNSPRLLLHCGGLQVEEHQAGDLFRGSATFSQNQRGRAMELAIPWNTLFLGAYTDTTRCPRGPGARDTVFQAVGDTVSRIPRGATIRLAALVVDKDNGFGGPDAAPDNTRGLSDQRSLLVSLDNYAVIELDRNDDTGLGGGGPDGVADWDVEPRSRVSFPFRPPIVGIRFQLDELTLDRGAFAPDRGQSTRFRFQVVPEPDPGDPANQVRSMLLVAEVFDLRGRPIRTLYAENRPVLGYLDPARDRWDGRDQDGAIVPPGIYVIRVFLERARTRPVAVVR